MDSQQVFIIQGDTGCGKTTQVPQIIMDFYTIKNMAASCNIIISQPRRISAISMAERVAEERQEEIGDVVGYQVRNFIFFLHFNFFFILLKNIQYNYFLKKQSLISEQYICFQVRLGQKLPRYPGSILFCTTGVFRNKLKLYPDLRGLSHVILDEAHDRTIDTDILMVLIKRAMQLNPQLKVIIMSATINAELFQKYFDCPMINVPGMLYPVETNFLEDIAKWKIHPSNEQKNIE